MSMSKLYGIIVVKCRISPNYFFDEMTPEEVSASIDAYFDEYKDRWERLRSSNHAVISSQSSKPIKATDVMEFVWDKESQMNGKGQLSKEDVEKIKQDLKDKFNLK